jgi:hypothetical protein
VKTLGARINLVVALPAEAKAINQILKLQRVQPEQGLPLYTGDGMALVVSGPGMQAVKTGVRQLQQCNARDRSGWLNIGIAGHTDLPLGQTVIASRVIGPEPGYDRDLQPLSCAGCRALPVCTVSRPMTDYPEVWAYDMEAAGFVASAEETTTLSRIQVLKVISDNRHHSIERINARMVKELFLPHASLIKRLVQRMQTYDPGICS